VNHALAVAIGITVFTIGMLRDKGEVADAPIPVADPGFMATVANTSLAPGPGPKGWCGFREPSSRWAPIRRTSTETRSACSRPIYRVYVDGFWMDKTEVTNEQFAAFVAATGYVTVAERPPRLQRA